MTALNRIARLYQIRLFGLAGCGCRQGFVFVVLWRVALSFAANEQSTFIVQKTWEIPRKLEDGSQFVL